MDRRRGFRMFACGGVFLLWAGVTPAAANTESRSVTAAVEPRAAATHPARTSPATDDCQSDSCIDLYLWSLYERTAKRDTVKIAERHAVKVKRKGKTRTVVKTVTRLVDEDFAWKDFKAAELSGRSPLEYVIGGMDRGFKRTLYRALRTMDDAGLEPGITSGFRDDYRQEIATGNKARTGRSYHGGSGRGGYGHGLAVDLVSVKGPTRAERFRASQVLWKWIDDHGHEVGIARPYLDRDPPHIGPIDGKEYADRRSTSIRLAAAKPTIRIVAIKTKPRRLAANAGHRNQHARNGVSKPQAGPARRSAASVKGRQRKSAT